VVLEKKEQLFPAKEDAGLCVMVMLVTGERALGWN